MNAISRTSDLRRTILFRFLVIVLLRFAGILRAELPTTVPVGDLSIEWKPAFKGVALAHVSATSPRPMELHAARIDLQATGLRFLATPPVADEPLPVRSLKTSSFLTKYHCQLAINTSPYAEVTDDEGKPQRIVGLAVSDGKVYGTAVHGNGALLISKDNHVFIGKPPFDMALAYNAAGGFGMVLIDGINVGDNNELHPRTGAGVTRDGHYLYLLVIDGRQPLYSEGATTAEVGRWLERLGSWNALNLDGGGSTALVIQGPDGQAQVLNRPIHKNKPGNERPNANHLGVFAEGLEK